MSRTRTKKVRLMCGFFLVVIGFDKWSENCTMESIMVPVMSPGMPASVEIFMSNLVGYMCT